MRGRVLVDLRNVYDPIAMREAGFDYHGIGRPGIDHHGIGHHGIGRAAV